MWKTILILAGVIIVLVVIRFSGQISHKIDDVEAYYSDKFHHAIDQKLYEGFKKTADKFNKRGPTMVNKNLRLDKTEAGPGARITYYYTFTNYTAHDINPDKLQANLKSKLATPLCNNKKVRPSIDLGATFVYVYHSKDGVELTHLEVNEKTCSLLSTG